MSEIYNSSASNANFITTVHEELMKSTSATDKLLMSIITLYILT